MQNATQQPNRVPTEQIRRELNKPQQGGQQVPQQQQNARRQPVSQPVQPQYQQSVRRPAPQQQEYEPRGYYPDQLPNEAFLEEDDEMDLVPQ